MKRVLLSLGLSSLIVVSYIVIDTLIYELFRNLTLTATLSIPLYFPAFIYYTLFPDRSAGVLTWIGFFISDVVLYAIPIYLILLIWSRRTFR